MPTITPARDEIAADPQPNRRPQRLRVVLLAIIALAVLVLAGTAGWLIRGGTSSAAAMPGVNSVDAGFARDMSTHHTQAVTMAGYERDTTTDPKLKVLAFDIETSQQFQIGQMQGWLDNWGLSRNSANQMSWMGSAHMTMGAGALMPGMATPAQMNTLESAKGKALDILFLQLMIHHHQGGIPMAKYAMEHATQPYVRRLAGAMYNAQSAEVIQMEQQLRSLGGTPLPAPSS